MCLSNTVPLDRAIQLNTVGYLVAFAKDWKASELKGTSYLPMPDVPLRVLENLSTCTVWWTIFKASHTTVILWIIPNRESVLNHLLDILIYLSL